MAKYYVERCELQGNIIVPASKSQTLRAILFASLGVGKSIVKGYLPSYDAFSMVAACRYLGAKIELEEEEIEIIGNEGRIIRAENVIDSGNSGIVLRFCTAIGALSSSFVVVTGDESIRRQRKMHSLLGALQQLQVEVHTMLDNDYAPVIIRGPIRSGKVFMDGGDSQPVSAMLIAGAFAEGPLEIIVENAGERPWIDLTLKWLTDLKIPFEHNGCYSRYYLYGGAKFEGFNYTVPGDFSSAAFPIVGALVTQSELVIRNLDMHDCQGDKEVISVLRKMGAIIEIDEKNRLLTVKKGGKLKGCTIDVNNFIDAIVILGVVGCFAEGETRITNAAIARSKECNRIKCIVEELKKMGADIAEAEDGIVVRKSSLKGAQVYSHHDHRMAMSLAIAAMGAEGETVIESVECVGKTYPGFARDFQAIGCRIKETQ